MDPATDTASEHELTLTVDGAERTATVPARTLLVHLLRDEFDCTAPKVGCETATCGACTVLLDGRSVKACNLLAVQADGGAVTTAAGLSEAADGDLHPVAAAFHEEHALQCGYCTPGMVTRAVELLDREGYSDPGGDRDPDLDRDPDPDGEPDRDPDLDRDPDPDGEPDRDPDRDRIRAALKGNVCRCTGYANVVDAVERAAAGTAGGGDRDPAPPPAAEGHREGGEG